MDEYTEEQFYEELLGAMEQERAQEVAEYARVAVEREMTAEALEKANEVCFQMPYESQTNNSDIQQALTVLEKEKRIEEKQNEILEEIEAESQEHLVRGAMLRCKCGSHCRRLNLPMTHGFMEEQRPLMNADDSSALPGGNIPYFGVCNSPSNQSGAATILLKKDYERDPFGKKISNVSSGNVRGTRCTPMILGSWQNVQNGTLIDGAPAITPSSFLICQFGGIIEVLDSGQHDDETLLGE